MWRDCVAVLLRWRSVLVTCGRSIYASNVPMGVQAAFDFYSTPRSVLRCSSLWISHAAPGHEGNRTATADDKDCRPPTIVERNLATLVVVQEYKVVIR